jgi:hypothetical protein
LTRKSSFGRFDENDARRAAPGSESRTFAVHG